MNPVRSLTLPCTLWMLVACSAPASVPDDSSQQNDLRSAHSAQRMDQIDGDWLISSLTGIDSLPTKNAPRLHIALQQISGSTGCNRFNGNMTAVAANFSINDIVTTKMLCAQRSELEQAFLSALREVRQSRWQNGSWIWLDQAGKPLATFQRP